MEFNIDKLLHGLKLIKQSVQLVIAHPVLLVYSVCSFVISSLISLLVIFIGFGVVATSITITSIQNPSTFLLSMFILTVLLTGVSLFFLACLAHHAMHILQNELHTVKETIHGVSQRLPKLSLWCIFKVIISIPWVMISILFGNFTVTFFSVTTIVWFVIVAIISYLTSLVLVILATEQTGIIAAVKRSYRLVVEYWMIFIGVFLIFHVLRFMVLNILIDQFAMLTYTIFYYEYYARPKPELAEMFYPDI